MDLAVQVVERLGDAAHVGQEFGNGDAGQYAGIFDHAALAVLTLAFLEALFQRFHGHGHLDEEFRDVQFREVGVFEFPGVVEEFAFRSEEPDAEIFEEVTVRLDVANGANGPKFLQRLIAFLDVVGADLDDLERTLVSALTLGLVHFPELARAEERHHPVARRQRDD